MLRSVFIPRPGYVFVEGDFSQLELRVAAWFSQDAVMLDAFRSGKDLHYETARLIAPMAFGMSTEEFERLYTSTDSAEKARGKELRVRAKTTNFALMYGTHPATLAQQWSVTVSQAEATVNAILGLFKSLKRCIAETQAKARVQLGVYVPWRGKPGNWRPLPGFGEQGEHGDAARGNAERAAWNTPCQGMAAHLMTASLARIAERFVFEDIDAHQLLTIHDADIVEVRVGQVREAMRAMREVMTSWGDELGVPLVVDFKVGESLGAMREVH